MIKGQNPGPDDPLEPNAFLTACWASSGRSVSLWRRAGVHPDVLARRAEADSFACLGLNRRDALWQAKALTAPKPLPLSGMDGEGCAEPAGVLPQMTLGQDVIEDYLAMRLSLPPACCRAIHICVRNFRTVFGDGRHKGGFGPTASALVQNEYY